MQCSWDAIRERIVSRIHSRSNVPWLNGLDLLQDSKVTWVKRSKWIVAHECWGGHWTECCLASKIASCVASKIASCVASGMSTKITSSMATKITSSMTTKIGSEMIQGRHRHRDEDPIRKRHLEEAAHLCLQRPMMSWHRERN